MLPTDKLRAITDDICIHIDNKVERYVCYNVGHRIDNKRQHGEAVHTRSLLTSGPLACEGLCVSTDKSQRYLVHTTATNVSLNGFTNMSSTIHCLTT